MEEVPTTSTCVVVGGSLAGCFAAAAAAPFFDRVLVLDRDKLETRPEALSRPNHDYASLCEESGRHKSVFQGMQMHALLAGGAEKIEKLLPGFKARCIESGATAVGGSKGCIIGKHVKMNYGNGPLDEMLAPEGYGLLSATRVLLERCARAKLLEIYANVCYQTPCKVEDVLFNAENRTVHGVKLASGEDIAADLVIDASGGRSHAITQFLENKCGQKVEVVKHSVALSYYTRFFKIPDKVLQQSPEERTYLSAVMCRAPNTDTGMYQTVEGNMYQALVSRMNGQKCGSSLEDFMDVMKSLPDQDVYETLKDAEPMGPALDCLGVKGTERHYYERLNMPEGYVVLGDAFAHLNPRFGSGMSASAFQALALREQLTLARQAGHPQNPEQVLTAGQLKGYSNRIQREAAKVLELPYSLVRDGDLQYDFCKGPRSNNPMAGLMATYFAGLMDLLPHNKEIASTWMMVLVFLWPPSMFFKPVIVKDVLAHLMTRSWTKMSSASRLAVMAFGLLVPAVVSTAVVRAF